MEDATPRATRFSFRRIGALGGMGTYLRPHRIGFAVGVVLISLSGILTLAVTRLWGELGGIGVGGAEAMESGWKRFVPWEVESLGDVGALIAIVLVIQAVLSYLRVLLFARMTEDMTLRMRNDAFAAVISLPMGFFDKRSVGDLNSRISADITAIQNIFTVTFAELLRQLIVVVGGIAALLYFSVTLTLLMLVTLPVMILAAIGFGRFIKRLAKRTQDEVAESNTVVAEALTGIVGVKAFANEALEQARYADRTSRIRTLALRGAVWRGAFSSFIILFIFGAITLVIFKGADLMAAGGLASGHFLSFLLMTGLVAGSIGGFAAMFSELQKGLGAIESLLELLREPREPITPTHPHPQLQPHPRPHPQPLTVSFSSVHFHYPTRPEVEVLDGFTLDIRPGEQVALVGASGAGKSTVAALLLRFREPTAGDLLIDGKPIASFPLTDYRNRLAYVPQEVILFGGDIRENIGYGRPGASDAEIEDAARRAHALDFIRGFPEGFATRVGERGVQLSGGQRQRIAIARAILRNPDLLVLDEATSALDTASEFEVQAALHELMRGRTSLVIAHRLSTVRAANRIAVLEAGKVVEVGSHEALMEAGGAYRKLVERQEFVA
jgi:ABC-type multidrug transport system fused ATPase/permease subunit